MPVHLFVYGTLRSGFSNPFARRLQAQSILLGTGSAPGTLYDFGWYPGAIFKAEARMRVVGEVFLLKNPQRLLSQLDHYEGTEEPATPFRRVAVKVSLDRGGGVEAWTYELSAATGRRPLIGSGDFVLHRRLRDQRPVRP
jgi:gamma-glutamylcyclotransferase (GGCT)/AIG2-like uncharacterized protein YtfP